MVGSVMYEYGNFMVGLVMNYRNIREKKVCCQDEFLREEYNWLAPDCIFKLILGWIDTMWDL